MSANCTEPSQVSPRPTLLWNSSHDASSGSGSSSDRVVERRLSTHILIAPPPSALASIRACVCLFPGRRVSSSLWLVTVRIGLDALRTWWWRVPCWVVVLSRCIAGIGRWREIVRGGIVILRWVASSSGIRRWWRRCITLVIIIVTAGLFMFVA